VVTLAALAGAPTYVQPGLRTAMIVVLGVMLGSSFTPEVLESLAGWTVSFLGLAAYTAIGGAAAFFFLWRICGYDRNTAYFAGMPGGFAEMVLAGEEAGADTRVITLIHAARILLVVMTLPFALQFLLNFDIASRPPPGAPLAEAPARDLVVLAGAGVVGYVLSRLLRIPGARLVGPMVVSAAVHLAGWTEAKPPVEAIYTAQVVVGSAIGARFAGTAFSTIRRAVLHSAGATAVLMAVTIGVAGLLAALANFGFLDLLLAYAPGGMAEMSLIGLALGANAAFVATHHIARIALVVIAAPAAFKLIARARRRAGAD
jgi:membrane AbrB-like protein